MANSTTLIFINPTDAFNHGDTFVFGSWVCIADSAGSFQRRLTMAPNPKTGLVTLPEVIMGDLAGKFGEISLYNQHVDFESGSASNSNSTSPWVIACESATEPSCVDTPLHEHFPYNLCNANRAHAEPLAARQAGKEIVSDYSSDSNPTSGYYLDSSYEFDFGSDPDEPVSKNSTTEQPLSGPATGRVITSTPVGRFFYWPDRKDADLTDGNSSCVVYLDSLPFRREHPELQQRRILQPRWRLLTPVSVPLIAKSSWPLARRQDLQGPDLAATSTTSQQTSCLPMHPPMKPTMTRTPDVNATGSATNDVDVSENPSLYGISQRPSIKSPAGCTLPRTVPHVYHYDSTSGSGDTHGKSHRQARGGCLLHES
jgi:hypothetical protein